MGRKRTNVPRVRKIKGQKRLKGISGKVRPTAQDVKIAEGIAAGMKKGEALIAAGVSPENARSNSAEILARPGVRAALAVALDKAGIGIDRVAQVLNDGLNATKIISANLLMTGERGEQVVDATENNQDENLQRIFIRVEDYPTRHKYLETSIDLLELRPEKNTGGPELPPAEEQNMISKAEEEAGKRDTARYFNRE